MEPVGQVATSMTAMSQLLADRRRPSPDSGFCRATWSLEREATRAP
jgi:hypothetical protein